MCYEKLEDAHAARVEASEAKQARAEETMAAAFMAACANMRADAVADFAPRITDHQQKSMHGVVPKRWQRVWETVWDAAEYPTEGRCELVQAFLELTYGQDIEAARTKARGVLEKLAGVYASQYAEVDE